MLSMRMTRPCCKMSFSTIHSFIVVVVVIFILFLRINARIISNSHCTVGVYKLEFHFNSFIVRFYEVHENFAMLRVEKCNDAS